MQGAAVLIHGCADTEFSVPQRGEEEVGGGSGGGKKAHSQLLVHLGAGPGGSNRSHVMDLTCTQISREINIDFPRTIQNWAKGPESMSPVLFVFQALPTQLSVTLSLSGS